LYAFSNVPVQISQIPALAWRRTSSSDTAPIPGKSKLDIMKQFMEESLQRLNWSPTQIAQVSQILEECTRSNIGFYTYDEVKEEFSLFLRLGFISPNIPIQGTMDAQPIREKIQERNSSLGIIVVKQESEPQVVLGQLQARMGEIKHEREQKARQAVELFQKYLQIWGWHEQTIMATVQLIQQIQSLAYIDTVLGTSQESIFFFVMDS